MHPALAIMLHPSPHDSGPDSEPEDGEEDGGDGKGKEAAAKAFFMAGKEGDFAKAAKCLGMFCDMHASPDGEESEDGEEDKKGDY